MVEREDRSQEKLFRTEPVPGKPGSGRLFDERPVTLEPVECLGMTFESEDARRTYFLDRLKEMLPDLRKRSDFPVGEDDDILRLSDPPWYTACPNPFLAEFVGQHGRPYDPDEPYHREPFAVDVSEGKTDPLYRAHGYHTKVPHRAIVPSILHYTKPGDLILDGFCGTGMTGVAAQWCETPPRSYRSEIDTRWQEQGWPPPEWGTRHTIQGDLSPAATFIAANYTTPFDVDAFDRAGRRLLGDLEADIGWMYDTLHADDGTGGRIDYTVWSEVFSCPECAGEVVFLREALDQATMRTRDWFPCPHCSVALSKDNLQRSFRTRSDPASGEPWQRIRLEPVLINARATDVGRFAKPPDRNDLTNLERIEHLPLPPEVPVNAFPIEQMYHGSRLAPKGFTHLHHLLLPRAAHALAALWRGAQACNEPRLRNMLLFFVEQAIWGMSLLNRYQPLQHGRPGGSQVNRQLSGVYYVGSQIAEVSPWYILNPDLFVLGSESWLN